MNMRRNSRPAPKRSRKNKSQNSKKFWDKEYRNVSSQGQSGKDIHLALSANPSEDLVKFTRWLFRETEQKYLKPVASVLDLGCGNGRNLIALSREYGMRGSGYDISPEAISQAKHIASAEKLPIEFSVGDMRDPIPLPDGSQTIVLDMMASHFLSTSQRMKLVAEIVRVLRPDGWLFLKTFLLDEDEHAKRLLREHPAGESGSYIHPEVGAAEHVSTEKELEDLLGEYFTIHKTSKSHRHIKKGRAWKRRSISVYAQKKF